MNLLSKRVLKQNTEPCNITKYKYLKDHHSTSLYNNIIFNINMYANCNDYTSTNSDQL